MAVDRAHRGNGCLQFIRSSHSLGRLEHGPVVAQGEQGRPVLTGPTGPPLYDFANGGQYGADPARVANALKSPSMEVVQVELAPGDCVFWHANLLHCSQENASNDPRWSFICCYNVASNTGGAGHRSYNPVDAWGSEQVMTVGEEQLAALQRGEGEVLTSRGGGLAVLDAAELKPESSSYRRGGDRRGGGSGGAKL